MEYFISGGPTPQQPACAEVQKICDEVKPEVEQNVGNQFPVFVAISFRYHAIAGLTYFIKVHVGGEKYVHLSVYQYQKVYLNKVQTGKTHKDPIDYF